MMMSYLGIIGLTASWRSGVWWLGIGRWRLFLRAPWNEPLFSEVYGFTKYRGVGGWRVGTRVVR